MRRVGWHLGFNKDGRKLIRQAPASELVRRSVVSALAIALLIAAVPAASAHGAPGVREIDERILIDGTAPNGTDYGAFPEQAPLFYEGGHDLLVLDIREARNSTTGEPILLFRLINQGGDPARGELLDILHFTVNDEELIVLFRTTDNRVYTGEGFDVFQTLDVGDDHVTGAEGGLYFTTLGLEVGDTLRDIWVEGRVGDAAADHMPGGYFFQGAQLGPASSAGRATYTIAGPPQLFVVESQSVKIEGALLMLPARVKNPLSLLSHIVVAETGTGPPTQLVLGPGDQRDVLLSWNVADALGGVNATLRSDLWDWQVLGHHVSPEELLAATPVDIDQPGQSEADAPLARGERYAATFNASGEYPLVFAGRTNQTVTVAVNSAGASSGVRLLVASGGALPERLQLAVGETLLVVNAASTPLRIVAEVSEEPSATSGPGLAMVLMAAIWAARRRRL
jgi:MYXO-CTERM domain-containing protein